MKSSTDLKVYVVIASPSSQRGQHSEGAIFSFMLVSSIGQISDVRNPVMLFSRHDTKTQQGPFPLLQCLWLQCQPKPITLDFVLVRVWNFGLTHNISLFDSSMWDSDEQLELT